MKNDRFTVSVNTVGAELCAFTEHTKEGDYAHLWEGDPDIWSGTSPLLFPVVGKCKNDAYTLGGKVYRMPKHGFAKKMEFVPTETNENEMVFRLSDTPETREVFPFAFDLFVCYRFIENGVSMTFRVVNKNEVPMYFSIGAHPAFAIKLGDRVVMDETETLSAYKLNADFLRAKELQPVFDNSRELVITEHLFDEDALIFDGVKSAGASIVRADGHNVHVSFGGAPCLGIWAKPAAPYVCIEPWYGIDDACEAGEHGTSGGAIENKHRIVELGAHETFAFPVEVTVV